MRYLPKHKNDTYNYANPTISDKTKRLLTKIFKKIFTAKNIIYAIVISLFIAIAVVIYLAIATVLIPAYIGYSAIIIIIIVSLLNG